MPSPFSAVADLTPADEAALARFFQRNDVPEVTARFYAFALDRDSARRICRQPGRDRYFAIFESRDVVALGMLRGWEDGPAAPSFGLLVDREFRARRLGKRLTRHALELARSLGAPRVRITIAGEDSSLLELARRLGFSIAEELPGGRLLLFAETGADRCLGTARFGP